MSMDKIAIALAISKTELLLGFLTGAHDNTHNVRPFIARATYRLADVASAMGYRIELIDILSDRKEEA